MPNIPRYAEQVAWKPGTALLDKESGELTHLSDALGYLVETEAGIRTMGGPSLF